MADTTKKYCVIHHFYHTGEECPFCSSERIRALSRKLNKDKTGDRPKKVSHKKEKEITQIDLEKLKDKFNVKMY